MNLSSHASIHCSSRVLFRRKGREKAFALVATITLLVLVALVCLGLLSLSTLSLRGSQQAEAQSRAQANARLSLMMALGQLQEAMGPDQRVSANAAIFDSNPETPEIEDVANPHMLGAWSTTLRDGKPIIYETSDGYHQDHRNWKDSSNIDHRGQVRTWLASGKESGFDPKVTLLDETNSFRFATSTSGQIRALKVKAANNGGYAYHISDLGVAAALQQYNPNLTTLPDPANPDARGYSNLYTGKKRPYGQLSETAAALHEVAADATVLDHGISSKYITLRSIENMQAGGLNQNARVLLKDYPQDYTVRNEALFTDSLRGGLRTDLTPYLRKSGDPGSDFLKGGSGQTILEDLDPLIPSMSMRTFSPKFGALRDFANLGKHVGTDLTTEPRAALAGGGYLRGFADPAKVVKQGLYPVITEYSCYFSLAPDTGSPTGLSLQYYPRVTLWNPYNVTIDASRYFVQLNQRQFIYFRVRKKNGSFNGSDDFWCDTSYWAAAHPNDPACGRPSYLYFFLENARLEPGQCLVFSPPTGVIQKLSNYNEDIGRNILTPLADIALSNRGCYTLPVNGKNANVPKYSTTDWGTDYYVYNQIIHGTAAQEAVLRIIPNSVTGKLSFNDLLNGVGTPTPRFPIVHCFDPCGRVNPEDYYGFWQYNTSDAVQMTSMNPAAQVHQPNKRTKLGGRLKAFHEYQSNEIQNPNAMWSYPLIEEANLKSGFYRANPWGLPTQSKTKPSWNNWWQTVSFGPITNEERVIPEYLDPFMLPRFDGVAESSPFMASQSYSGELRFTLFDIPPANIDFFNFAQLRSANLTQEASAPTFVIGESLATATAPRASTAFPRPEYQTNWWKGLNEKNVKSQYYSNKEIQCTWWDPAYDPATNYAAFDYRYETNHALWDRYFLSTLPENAKLTSYQGANHLPNPHIAVSDKAEILLGTAQATAPDRIAEHLVLKNHLSANSTSVVAWKALLSMNRGLGFVGKSINSEKTSFPGSANPPSESGTAGQSNNDLAWNGYRELSDAEIDLLAKEIVVQVKRRAPFISVGDFINRRLYDLRNDASLFKAPSQQSEEEFLSYAGALDLAIYKAGLNNGFSDFQVEAASQYNATNNAPMPATANMPVHTFAGAPGYLTQGKLLQAIGTSLTARSDTFLIRGYGEAKDPSGNVIARAVCEATAQRNPEYVDAALDNPAVAVDALISPVNRKFGRRFKLTTFKWVGMNEI